jgi:hypothetical protein
MPMICISLAYHLSPNRKIYHGDAESAEEMVGGRKGLTAN